MRNPALRTSPATHRNAVSAAVVFLTTAMLGACANVPNAATSTEAPKASATATVSGSAPGSAPVSTTAVASASAPAASRPAQTASSAVATASAPAGAASRPAPDPTAPKPFAEITRDAKETKGYISVWTKDEKTWLEIPEANFRKPFMLMANISNSVGERGLYASQMGPSWMVEWRKVGNTVQLVALNEEFRSPDDKQMAFAVKQAFSDSLLFSTPVASAPHPERKSVLIDANALLSDIPNYGRNIEAAFRIAYNHDRANSQIVSTRTEGD